jgi:hypothetical protein
MLKERGIQGWRAIAINKSGSEHLITLGKCHNDVSEKYVTAFKSVLTTEEQKEITKIQLQKWLGIADRGIWTNNGSLTIPTKG